MEKVYIFEPICRNNLGIVSPFVEYCFLTWTMISTLNLKCFKRFNIFF